LFVKTGGVEINSERKKRATVASVAERREVLKAIAGIGDHLAELQREAAFLKAAIERGRGQADLEPQIVTLGTKIAVERQKLERAVAFLPERLRGHGRITDLRRAMEALEASAPRLSAGLP
jgi:hypothetical protein